VIAKYSRFHGWALNHSVFNIALVVWIFLSLIYFTLKPREKINDGMEIKLKDLSAK